MTSEIHEGRRGPSLRRLKAPRLDLTDGDSAGGDGACTEGGWDVIVLEDVPAGAFVCEWTGQYVLGGIS